MTVHTMLLRDLIISMEGREKFFEYALNEYPIFDESYRHYLNNRIVEHYWLREIGQETPEMFVWYMRTTMNENMPIYNGLYRTVNADYDFLDNMDYESVLKGITVGENNSNAVANTNSTAKNNSDAKSTNYAMPNTSLTANRGDYATDANRTTGLTDSSTVSKSDSVTMDNQRMNQDSTTRVKGRNGSPSQLIAEYRQNLISVDLEVINSLADCFMGVWYNGDGYRGSRFVPFMNYGVGYSGYGYI